jgi:hypothetical protein
LGLFPAESRANLAAGISTLFKTLGGPPKSAKEAGSFRTQVIHWLKFCKDMKLEDDMSLERVDLTRCHWQLGLCAIHLATGNSVSCRALKAATVEKHVRSVARFCSRGNPRDPRKLDQTQKPLAPVIQGVLDEVKRWENIPDRREPFTIEMLNYLKEEYVKNPPKYGPDSYLAVLIDYFSAGLYDGFRLSEWAQPNGHSEIRNPQLNIRGDSMAFCLGDIRFASDDKIAVHLQTILQLDPKSVVVGRSYVKCRTQKNGSNGEERQHTRNPGSSGVCHVESTMRIVQRFVRLVGKKQNVPLCVYRHKGKELRYITASLIESTMRRAAIHVYKLDPVRDQAHINKWSAHSLRVGACVILHGMGFTDTQIQFLLRWRSNAFYVYLRNIAGLANKQNAAITDLSTMPHFI